jgi:K+-transporting ATPase A subunit
VGALLKKLSVALLEVSSLSGQFKVMAATPSARLHYIALLGTAGEIIYNGNSASHCYV